MEGLCFSPVFQIIVLRVTLNQFRKNLRSMVISKLNGSNSIFSRNFIMIRIEYIIFLDNNKEKLMP